MTHRPPSLNFLPLPHPLAHVPVLSSLTKCSRGTRTAPLQRDPQRGPREPPFAGPVHLCRGRLGGVTGRLVSSSHSIVLLGNHGAFVGGAEGRLVVVPWKRAINREIGN